MQSDSMHEQTIKHLNADGSQQMSGD